MGFFTGGSSPSQFTIGELMNIDNTRQQKASACKVELVKVFHELQNESLLNKFKASLFGKNTINTYYLILKFKVTSDTGSEHKVYVRLSPDFNMNAYLNNKIKIYCDCEDFKYRTAYTLGKRDSVFLSNIVKTKLGPSLTEPPRKQYTTLLCKHSYAVLNWLIDNYAAIMKS